MLSSLLGSLRSTRTWKVFLFLGLLTYFSSTVVAVAHYHHHANPLEQHQKEKTLYANKKISDCPACQLLTLGQPQPEISEKQCLTTVVVKPVKLGIPPEKTRPYHHLIRAPPYSILS